MVNSKENDKFDLGVKGKRIHFTLLHPTFNIHILITVLFIFPTALIRRVCMTIRCFLNW